MHKRPTITGSLIIRRAHVEMIAVSRRNRPYHRFLFNIVVPVFPFVGHMAVEPNRFRLRLGFGVRIGVRVRIRIWVWVRFGFRLGFLFRRRRFTIRRACNSNIRTLQVNVRRVRACWTR
jgi:hypothetical protein